MFRTTLLDILSSILIGKRFLCVSSNKDMKSDFRRNNSSKLYTISSVHIFKNEKYKAISNHNAHIQGPWESARSLLTHYTKWLNIYISISNEVQSIYCTVYPRSLDQFYIVSYYIEWVKTSWIYSIIFHSVPMQYSRHTTIKHFHFSRKQKVCVSCSMAF